LYVKEFGRDAPPAYRGKVLLECMDGTPLFNGETADERQRCLSAIAQGYMDFVGKEGFAEVLIRVPPPTDKHAHLFSARSADVQLKASHHLSQWYLRIMQWGMRVGTLSDYQCSPDGGDIAFPLSILSRRDNEAEASFKRMCAKLDTQCRALCTNFRTLPAPTAFLWLRCTLPRMHSRPRVMGMASAMMAWAIWAVICR